MEAKHRDVRQAAQVFRRRGYKNAEGWRFLLILLAMVLLPLVAVWENPFLYVMASPSEVAGYEQTQPDASRFRDSMTMLSFTLPLLVLILFVGATTRQRLYVSERGIALDNGLPARLKWLRPEWAIYWDEIVAVSPGGSLFSEPLRKRVVLQTATKRVVLEPGFWVDPAEPQISELHLLRLKPEDKLELFERSPLMRLFRERGLWQEQPARGTVFQQEFEQEPVVLALAAVFVACIVYFCVDFLFLLDEFYAGPPPYAAFALIGLSGAAAAAAVIRKGEPMQRYVFVLMVGLGVGLASYPGILRINTTTDEGGFRSVSYQLASGTEWYSVEADAPVLTFDRNTGYWAQFKPGDRKDFELRQGGLGIYQIHMAPIYEEQRAFYRNR